MVTGYDLIVLAKFLATVKMLVWLVQPNYLHVQLSAFISTLYYTESTNGMNQLLAGHTFNVTRIHWDLHYCVVNGTSCKKNHLQFYKIPGLNEFICYLHRVTLLEQFFFLRLFSLQLIGDNTVLFHYRYLLILDRTNWKTNMLTALLVPYIFFTLPNVLFSLIR